jgi:hypothetical protein
MENKMKMMVSLIRMISNFKMRRVILRMKER